MSTKFLFVIKQTEKEWGEGEIEGIEHSPFGSEVTPYRRYGNNRTWHVISIVAENEPHARETHLHRMEVVTILIREHIWYPPTKEKKRLHFLSLAAKASETKELVM